LSFDADLSPSQIANVAGAEVLFVLYIRLFYKFLGEPQRTISYSEKLSNIAAVNAEDDLTAE